MLSRRTHFKSAAHTCNKKSEREIEASSEASSDASREEEKGKQRRKQGGKKQGGKEKEKENLLILNSKNAGDKKIASIARYNHNIYVLKKLF